MKDLTEHSQNPDFERAALGEKPVIFNTCPLCGDRLCPHGICRKAEPEYACQECFCSECGADLCKHGHCENYCDLGGDGPCPECWERMCLEQDAEDNARYYSGEKPE